MSRTNETKHIEWHETCKCICTLDGIICNNKQRWNEDNCGYECKELIDKSMCDEGFFGIQVIVNVNVINLVILANIQIVKIGKVEKKLIDPLIEECSENIGETNINNNEAKITNEKENKHKYSFFVVYIVLLSIILTMNIGIGIYFAYHKYVNRNRNNKYDLPY